MADAQTANGSRALATGAASGGPRAPHLQPALPSWVDDKQVHTRRGRRGAEWETPDQRGWRAGGFGPCARAGSFAAGALLDG